MEPVDYASPHPHPADDVVARRATYYRNTRIIVVVMILGFALAFLYDGFVRYPEYNRKFDAAPAAEQLRMEHKHSDRDIELQRQLAFILLPVGLLLIGWFLFNSRGEYRLSGTTLTVPGHPPIPFDAVTDVDKSKWDRKGIAYVQYQLPNNGPSGRVKIDDFVYDRKPTDEIISRLDAHRAPPAAQEETEIQPQMNTDEHG